MQACLAESSQTTMAACVVPDYPVLMTTPTDSYFDSFEILTNASLLDRSSGLYYYDMIYGSDPGSMPYVVDLPHPRCFFTDRSPNLQIRRRLDYPATLVLLSAFLTINSLLRILRLTRRQINYLQMPLPQNSLSIPFNRSIKKTFHNWAASF